MGYRTRFAPSPTGPLHLGHAYSALVGAGRARDAGGTFLVRIEDLDTSRARPEWEAQIHTDLHWLGLSYPRPALRQSDRAATYDAALGGLWDRGLLYPCTCTRRDILTALSAPQEGAPPTGPDGLVYPGTCRPAEGAPRPRAGTLPPEGALRLDMSRALGTTGPIHFVESGVPASGSATRIEVAARTLRHEIGDIAVRRPGMGAAYHMAVVVDDAEQGITEVVRGEDLFETTAIHVVLQRLLGLPTPAYHHHRLVRDEAGKRLAKRDDARAIAAYRAEGRTPDDLRVLVGLPPQSMGAISSVSPASDTAR